MNIGLVKFGFLEILRNGFNYEGKKYLLII